MPNNWCFDTIYRTNKNLRPFVPFIGFNHHRKSVLFGATLLYDETATSFEWLLKTFLKAMCGKKPKTIFTYQDAAMAKAISEIFPETYHRLCLWHLFQNALKNLNHALRDQILLLWIWEVAFMILNMRMTFLQLGIHYLKSTTFTKINGCKISIRKKKNRL